MLAVLAALLAVSWPNAASAAPKGPGTLKLTIATPPGATALVEISRVDSATPVRVVTHGEGDPATASIALEAGTYRVRPRALIVGDQRYVAKSTTQKIRIRSGATASSTVSYILSKGIQNLRATGLSTTSITLDWDAGHDSDITVWRVPGDRPPSKPGRGTKITVAGTALSDTGLTPGTTYTYAFFNDDDDDDHDDHGDDDDDASAGDPVTITVGTAAADGSAGQPQFVLNPRTRVLALTDFVAAEPTGTGVRLDLAPGVITPVPGSILSIPVTQTLAGGYLGEVGTVSTDGRTVWLKPAALAAAFDLYRLTVPDFEATAAAPAAALGQATGLETPGEEDRARSSRSGRPTDGQTFALASGKVECSFAAGASVTPHLGLSHAGHADVTIDKYHVLLVDVPVGVGIDLGYTATLSGTIDIEASNAYECGLPLDDYFKQIVYYPVPIGLNVRPEVEIGVSASGSITNLGFAATAGFEVDGYLGFAGDNFLDGDLINTSSPTQPTATGSLGLGLSVGGSVVFGPGVGSSDAGVVVGVGGELFIVDASASVKAVNNGQSTSTCIELSAATRIGMSADLRAWIPGYEVDYTATIDALQGTFPWLGSPWHWPNDCTGGNNPTDDVVGDGVTVLGDDLTGSPDQWGKVEGFVPGENTWVLSTGRIQEAVGAPGFFASTAMGQAGDAELSALAGFPTNDAATYSVTLVANGQTLHVEYVFASEEYPEYVGSRFNDVMAVFVDGQNCALVPGTQTPVAINSINPGLNSQYYVDNTTGANGYATTMDGLTTTLTCTVPVNPGQPVTVKIAIADASDSIYDSAVALLDGGIWSE